MPSNTIDANLITQFSDMLHVNQQQIRARLRPFFQVMPMVGDRFAYDSLGAVEAREVNGRIVKTVFDDIEHLRRRIKRRRFVVTLPIDASDVRGMLLNPQGPYSAASIRAMERVFDRVGVEASFADVLTGREFDTTTTFAGDGGNTINATAGVTYEKLLETSKFWRNNEVGTDIPVKRLLLITGTEEEALMKENELTNGDFSRRFVVDRGEIVEGAGFQFIYYGADVPNPILAVNSGTRDCVAVTSGSSVQGIPSGGLAYGLSKRMSISVDRRPDYVELTQVQIVGELGAVRTEGALVQKFQTTA